MSHTYQLLTPPQSPLSPFWGNNCHILPSETIIAECLEVVLNSECELVIQHILTKMKDILLKAPQIFISIDWNPIIHMSLFAHSNKFAINNLHVSKELLSLDKLNKGELELIARMIGGAWKRVRGIINVQLMETTLFFVRNGTFANNFRIRSRGNK